ncbi:MAG: hypothetical protein MJ090_03090 [Clostridia bacterium]|nr:hypothetical protein [Clostridia bacterium]
MKEHKALKIFLLIVVSAFVIHQLYSALYNPVTTQTAEFYKATDGISANAIVIRQEKIVKNDSDKTLHYKVLNGSRIAKGGTLADIYNDSNASVTVNKIEDLNEKIADIKEISGYNDVAASDLDIVKEKVNDSYNNFIKSCATGKYTETESFESALLSAENRKQFITGETIDFSKKLSSLKSELASYKASLPSPIGKIKAEKSGYFVSSVDGFEDVLTQQTLDNITPETFDELKPEATKKNQIGKIVYGYDWYLAVNLTLDKSLKYKVGDELTVKTNVRNNPSLDVVVERINTSNDKAEAVVILACQEMNSELATLRSLSLTIVNREYSGLKISKKALRVVDGKSGVYVVSGVTVKFVPINVVYSSNEYIVCEQQTENSSSVLRLYDEVVVKGKNLYDGKIIG